jgi:phosphatidylglycerophosphatase A
MESAIIRFFTIYLVGITGMWKAIPVGMALKSTLLETSVFTALGSITAVFILYYFGESVKRWVLKKWDKNKLERKKGKFSTIMDKYGVAGLGLICPGLFGPITSIIVGLLIINKTSRLMPYLVAGIILWSFLLTWLATTSFDLAKSLV